MKKYLALILALALCVVVLVPTAYGVDNNVPRFDYKEELGDLRGFTTNPGTDEWSWYGQCTMQYSDADATVGIRTEGVVNPNIAILYATINDKSGAKYASVTGVEFQIGSDIYAYETMMETDERSFVSLGANGNLLIEALAYCDPADVTINVIFNNSRLSLPFDAGQIERIFKSYCLDYVQKGIWSYNTEKTTTALAEVMYPLKINGINADYETMHVDHPATVTPPSTTGTTQGPSQSAGNEINPDIPLGTSYEFGQGEYECGDDIPAGRYQIQWVSGNPNGGFLNPIEGCEQLGYQVSIYTDLPYTCEMKKGDVFEVSLCTVRFTKVTSLQNDSYKQNDGTYLIGPGDFYVGIDFPAGKYNVTPVAGNPQGLYVNIGEDNFISLKQGETYNNLRLKKSGTLVNITLGQVRLDPVG